MFTLNEERNLPLCLDGLWWTDDVIVIDSYSTDRTLEICNERNIRVYQRQFDGFGSQRNWAIENVDKKYSWILILDADERVPRELAQEIQERIAEDDEKVCAYRIRRRFYLWGKWLKHSSLYPTWVIRLIRDEKVRYVNRGHAETQIVDGEIGVLANDIIDESHKGIDAWFERQNQYSRKEAEYEIDQQRQPFRAMEIFSRDPVVQRSAMKRLSWAIPGRAFWYFVYSYIWRRGFLDGKEGLMFCLMRSMYQRMITIKKFDIEKGK